MNSARFRLAGDTCFISNFVLGARDYAITFLKASWNFFISSARPTVTRMCVGQTGHGRPT